MNEANIYLLRSTSIVIYNIMWNTWVVQNIDFKNVYINTCGITQNGEYIYIFAEFPWSVKIEGVYGGYDLGIIIEYATRTYTWSTLSAPNLCRREAGDRVSTITGKNNKLYLHGCAAGSWQTLIFDTYTKQFMSDVVTINSPTTFAVEYSKAGQLAVYDDNKIILIHKSYYLDINVTEYSLWTESAMSVYFGLTEDVSINLTPTLLFGPHEILSVVTFPSWGFHWKYSVDDYHNIASNGEYHIFIYNDQMMDYTLIPIILDIYKDRCNCNGSLSPHRVCTECSRYFDLGRYLTVEDNNRGLGKVLDTQQA